MLGVDRGRYTVLVDEGGAATSARSRRRARASSASKSVVTGDHVDLVGDTTGEQGTPRAASCGSASASTLLRRSADDTDEVERIIVANADQMLIVVAAANPEPRIRLVDRYLVAAFDAGIRPILSSPRPTSPTRPSSSTNFAGLDLPVFRSSTERMPLEEITRALVGHRTVFVGHSGVGKSTLVNALVPSADRAIGRVNEVTGRGRHTSSSTISLRVEDERGGTGWVIDTPGVRSFGLGHVDPRTSSARSPTSRASPRTARAAAPTCPTRPTAR